MSFDFHSQPAMKTSTLKWWISGKRAPILMIFRPKYCRFLLVRNDMMTTVKKIVAHYLATYSRVGVLPVPKNPQPAKNNGRWNFGWHHGKVTPVEIVSTFGLIHGKVALGIMSSKMLLANISWNFGWPSQNSMESVKFFRSKFGNRSVSQDEINLSRIIFRNDYFV